MKTTDKILKEKFTKMFEFVQPTGNGIVCFFEHIEHGTKMTDDVDYLFLKEKMIKLLDLVNNDLSLLDKDMEDELWYMV